MLRSKHQDVSDDPLKRLFESVVSRSWEAKKRSSKRIRKLVEAEARTRTSEQFARFLNEATGKISELINSSDSNEQTGAILVIDELVELKHDSEAMIVRFANALRRLLQHHTDAAVLGLAAQALGHLARSGGAFTVDIVKFEVNQALEWLHTSRSEHRKRAAVLMLKELAQNAPTLFNIHVNEFLHQIWVGLRDLHVDIRIGARDALHNCLVDLGSRNKAWQVECLSRVYSEAQHAFVRKTNTSSIHGSLLVFGELLSDVTGGFLKDRFTEVTETVLRYQKNKDTLIQNSVAILLPKCAALDPKTFVDRYLDVSLKFLIQYAKYNNRDNPAFISIGEMSIALGQSIVPHLPVIMPLIQVELQPTRRRRAMFSNKALKCISMLARAVKSELTPYMKSLVAEMFQGDMSSALIEALSEIASHMPNLLPDIQNRLLAAIAEVMVTLDPTQDTVRVTTEKARVPTYGSPLAVAVRSNGTPKNNSPEAGGTPGVSPSVKPLVGIMSASKKVERDLQSEEAVSSLCLALDTLATFDFQGKQLLPFLQECVVSYLYHRSSAVRKACVAACNKTLVDASSSLRYQHAISIMFDILQKLAHVAIADEDPVVRFAVLEGFDPRLDSFLAQQELLDILFAARNDEVIHVREIAITLLGRLANRNPAFVLPALRKTLIQLLSELKQLGADTLDLEQSAQLLGHLITSAQKLIRPYVRPILEVLVPMLKDPRDGLTSSVLKTLGRLATIGGTGMLASMDEIIPFIVNTLTDKASLDRRQVALRTLGQLVESTGCVIEPYRKYPKLLPTILSCLKGEQNWIVRAEVQKVLGIIGAFDPFQYKAIMERAAREDKISLRAKAQYTAHQAQINFTIGSQSNAFRVGDDDEQPAQVVSKLLPRLMQSPEDYYPTVAITALMRILREPTLSQHHGLVITAVMFIFRTLGLKSVQYLPQTFPPFLQEIRMCEDSLRENFFQHLASLVGIVKQHVRNYLDSIFELVLEFWDHTHLLRSILDIIDQIAFAVKDEFKDQLPRLIPHMLTSIHSDRSKDRCNISRILHSFRVFSNAGNLDAYLYVITPELVRLCEQTDVPIEIRRSAVLTISYLARTHEMTEYVPRLIHPFARILSTGPPQLHNYVMVAVVLLVYQLGIAYEVYEPTIGKVLTPNRAKLLSSAEDSSRIYKLYFRMMDHMSRQQPVRGRHLITFAGEMKELSLIGPVRSLEVAQTEFDSWFDGDFQMHVAEFLSSGDDVDGFLSEVGHSAMEGAGDVDVASGLKKVNVNQENLESVWQASQRSTREDWSDWMRGLSIELLRESPSPALRACSSLALKYPPLAQELFNAAFLSCWRELDDQYQDRFIDNIQLALKAKSISQKVAQMLLDLNEFMEHDDQPLPIDSHTLGNLADKFHAYAKALHFKEAEFRISPEKTIDALIRVNNELQQLEGAQGILKYARDHFEVEVKETVYEQLQRWEDAMAIYEQKQLQEPGNTHYLLGRIRCLNALGEWERVCALVGKSWHKIEDAQLKSRMAPLAAEASWNLLKWPQMRDYVERISPSRAEGAFFRAVLAINASQFSRAKKWIAQTRESLDAELTAKIGEGYNRAYNVIVQIQQLAELEEVIQFKLATEEPTDKQKASKRAFWRQVWEKRLSGAKYEVDTWSRLLGVRCLVIPPKKDIPAWIRFSSLCRKSGQVSRSVRILHHLLGMNPLTLVNDSVKMPTEEPQVTVAALKLMWSVGFLKPALRRMRELLDSMDKLDNDATRRLKSHCYVKLGEWKLSLAADEHALATSRLDPLTSALSVMNEGSEEEPMSPMSPMSPLSATFDDNAAPVFAGGSDSDTDSDDVHPRVLGKPSHRRDSIMLRMPVRPRTRTLERKAQVPGRPNVIVASVEDSEASRERHRSRSRKELHSPSTDSMNSPARLQRSSGYRTRPSIVFINPAKYDTAMPEALEAFRAATQLEDSNFHAWHAWAVVNFRVVSTYSKRSTDTLNIPDNYDVSRHLEHAIDGFFRAIDLQNRGATSSLQDILRLLTLLFEHGANETVCRAFMKGFERVNVETWLLVIPQVIARIDVKPEMVNRVVNNILMALGSKHPQALVYPLTVVSKSPAPQRVKAAETILSAMSTHSPELVRQARIVSNELVRVAILWLEMWQTVIEEAFRLYFQFNDFEGMFNVLKPLHEMMAEGPKTRKEVQFKQQYGQDLSEALEWARKYEVTRNKADLNRSNDIYHMVLKKIMKQVNAMTHLELEAVSPRLLSMRNLVLAVPGTYRVGAPIISIAAFDNALKVIDSKQHPRKLRIQCSDGSTCSFLLKGHEDLRQDERVMQLFGLVNTMLAGDPQAARRGLDIKRFAVIPLSPNSGLIEWVPHCDTIHALIKQYRETRRICMTIEQLLIRRVTPDYAMLSLIQKIEIFDYVLSCTSGSDLCEVLWLKSQNAEVWLDRRTNYTRSLAVMSMVGYILGLGDRHTCNIMIDRMSGKVVHIDFGDCFEVAAHRDKFPEKIPFRLTRMLINAMEVSGIEGNFRTTCETVMHMLRDNKESIVAVLEAFVYDPLINWRLVNRHNKNVEDVKAPRRASMANIRAAESQSTGGGEILNAKALRVIHRVQDKLSGRDFDPLAALDVQTQVQRLIKEATSHANLCQCYIGWCPFW